MLFPHPHPSFENVDPLPHNAKIRMIQIKEEQHPLLLSFPHPQFVATRSLIRNPPKYLHCILCWFLQLVTENAKSKANGNKGKKTVLRTAFSLYTYNCLCQGSARG